MISQADYDWANGEMFNNTLPPHEKIYITDHRLGWTPLHLPPVRRYHRH